MIINKNNVWVFDLDDTLYKERDYQISGYNSIASLIHQFYQQDVNPIIKQAIKDKEDVLQSICNYLNLPLSVKDSLLWQYRNHIPKLILDDETKQTLSHIEKGSLAIAILTDGRSISQRAKIASFGLSHYDLYISEEWGKDKPDDKRFLAIMDKYPCADSFIYVGDNIKKDFITPNKLGWITIGLKDDGRNIHHQDIHNLSSEYIPQYWVSNFKAILNYYI
ncbi:HAD family hydrolase [Photobacterium iliopiscarium]|uniref:HAD family hydrolase n=1 Tax=Photobacterium iliopiscarium TaxID=56192 RepID=UPI001E5B96CA|nr:HAD family hydrolase [Photobacterium iliopiscarium]MCD9486618.1 HAD-IA family hydrolase [Photobacterium iliopiscarium]MCF2243219.1 HAD-IA family hydrolase [Photobacterium iliopiscarium]